MKVVISNLKLSIFRSKISSHIIERFYMSTIDNKYIRSTPILQSIFKALANSISILSYFSCLGIENLDANNKNNKSEVKTEIELKDEINLDKLICQTKRVSSQY